MDNPQHSLDDALKPCRACGAPCRVERFGGSHIVGVMVLYMCANSAKFGGDCPDPHAYLSVNAWNTRAALEAAGVAELREALEHIARGDVGGDPNEPFSGHMNCRKVALAALNPRQNEEEGE